MNWFKAILLGIVFSLTISLYWLISRPVISPKTTTNSTSTFLNRLDFALQANNLSLAGSPQISTILSTCTFSLNLATQNTTPTIIFSLKKDPYFQVASLQKIINQSKMKNKHVVLIDLSLNHPYATFQDY